MFALPQIFSMPVVSVGVAGGIEMPWLGAYVAGTLLAALVVSSLGLLREVRRSRARRVQCRGAEPTPRARQRSRCPLTGARTQLEVAPRLS